MMTSSRCRSAKYPTMPARKSPATRSRSQRRRTSAAAQPMAKSQSTAGADSCTVGSVRSSGPHRRARATTTTARLMRMGDLV